jgi:hypothetical protein
MLLFGIGRLMSFLMKAFATCFKPPPDYMIIAQRLVRKICSACVLSYKISEEQKNLVKEILVSTVHEKVVSIPETLYKGRGCKICSHSGFVGQIGIYEVLKVDVQSSRLEITEIRTAVCFAVTFSARHPRFDVLHLHLALPHVPRAHVHDAVRSSVLRANVSVKLKPRPWRRSKPLTS